MRRRGVDSRRVRNGRVFAVLLSTATAAGIVASIVLLSSAPSSGGSAQIRRLAEVVGPHRVIRARLTGGFAYAACAPSSLPDSAITGLVCRETTPATWAQARELSDFAAALRSPDAWSAPGGRHAAGSWHVVWGNADAAIRALRAAAQDEPADARVQSDLAAAYLQRAELQQDPLAILDAYTAVDSALALDSGLPEARFNRAVALEWLHLSEEAVGAWSSFLELDDRSSWAEEARARREHLRREPASWRSARDELRNAIDAGDDSAAHKIVAQFPWRVHEQVRGTMIAWAHAYLTGDSSARSLLRQATALARGLERTTGDVLWADATRRIVDHTTRDERDRLDATARGLVAYERGRAYLFDRLMLDSAKHWLDVAHRTLVESANAAAHWAAFDLSLVSFQRHTAGADDEALARLRRILATTPDEYRAVRGFASRQVGVIEGTRFNYDHAISALGDAIDEGRVIGDPVLDLRARNSVARLSAQVRGELVAWRHLYQAFGAAARYAESQQALQRLLGAAAELSWRKWPAAAALFQDKVVRLASESTTSLNDSLLLVTALTIQADLFAREGRFAQARQSLRKTREHIAHITSDSIRAVYSSDADLVDAQVALRVRPDSAIRLLQQVVRRYNAAKYFVQVGRANLLLANAYAATGAMDSAQVVFEATLSEMERRREGIGELEERARFLDHARPVIDTIARFLADRGDTLRALEFVERMRARVLLERVDERPAGAPMRSSRVPSRSVTAVQRALPQGTNVVSYLVLDDELVAWLISRDGVSMYRVPLTVRLGDLVDRFMTLINSRADDRELREAAGRLHEVLIKPFADRLEPDSKLVLVPDKALHFVPFAALFDPHRRRFLVESFDISVAPSVQLFHASLSRFAALRTSRAPAVLAVGNPSFDRRAFALPVLPGAEREATRVAKQYGSSARLLIGPDATKDAFLRAAAASNVIHFAGHGVVRPEAPLLSYLVFAPDAGGESSGALYAKDLFEITLPTTRLAILSGCYTAGGSVSDTEGASSLARALFAAGVPAVVASLWAVDDERTDEFFAAYHLELARGLDPTTALRQTQMQWIRGRGDLEGWRSISTWAAFQLFGATG